MVRMRFKTASALKKFNRQIEESKVEVYWGLLEVALPAAVELDEG